MEPPERRDRESEREESDRQRSNVQRKATLPTRHVTRSTVQGRVRRLLLVGRLDRQDPHDAARVQQERLTRRLVRHRGDELRRVGRRASSSTS